jgi:AraC family transcriptional regulator
MEPRIIEKGKATLVGMAYYGPIGGEGWSKENQIGQLWQRFNRFCETKWQLIEDHVINPKVAYEVAIWNEDEFEETQGFYVFVGVEVEQIADLPLELVSTVLPASTYAHLTPKGREITTWEGYVYNEWLPKSGYQLASLHDYHFQIQAYEEGRFKGLGELLEESEMNVYIPITQSQ